MSNSTTPIPRLVEYFETDELPLIIQSFTPTTGWKRYPMHKRVSRSWLRKMRAEGITHVSLAVRCQLGGADFSVRELLR